MKCLIFQSIHTFNFFSHFCYCEFIGSIQAWKEVNYKMRKYADPAGLKYFNLCLKQLEPLDKALIKGDMTGVAESVRNLVQNARKILPHINKENLKKPFEKLLDGGDDFLEKLKSGSGDISAFSNFTKSGSTDLNDILETLIDKVTDVVGDVVDSLI